MTKHNKFYNNNRNNNRNYNNRAPAQHEDTGENVEEVPRPDLALGSQRGSQRGSAGGVNLSISGSAEDIMNMMNMMRGPPQAPQPMYHFGSGNGPATTFQAPYQQAQPRDNLAAKGQRGGPNNNRGRGGRGRGRGRGNHDMGRPASSGRNNAEQSTASNALVHVPVQKAKCANCKRLGHRILRCVGPPDRWGFIPGCPWCNDPDHIWEECSSFPDGDMDIIGKYLLEMRADLPPLSCTEPLSNIPGTGVGGKFHGKLPWTTTCTINFYKKNPDYWKDYVYNANRIDDVVLGKCDWSNPENIGEMSNTIPKSSLRHVQATRPVPKNKRKTFNGEEQNPKRQKPDEEDEEMNDTPLQEGQTALQLRPAPLQNLGAATVQMGTQFGSMMEGLGANVVAVQTKRGTKYQVVTPGGCSQSQEIR